MAKTKTKAKGADGNGKQVAIWVALIGAGATIIGAGATVLVGWWQKPIHPPGQKLRDVTIVVEIDQTASVYNGLLSIKVNEIKNMDSVSGNAVSAVINSTGCEPLRFEDKGDGHRETYKCKETFDIEIVTINKGSATFKVFRKS